MLIPPQVAKNVGKIAAKEGTRYAINGVLLQRKGDACIAAATDGQMLLRLRWQDEDRSEYPSTDGLSVEPKTDFATLIPARDLADMAKLSPRRPSKPIEGRIVLDEQASNGTAVFGVSDSANTQTHRVNPVDGHFPYYQDVIPRYRVGHDAVEIGVTPELLSRLLMAMSKSATSCDNKGVRMTVPIHPAKPILLESRDKEEGVEGTGVIMPISVGGDRGSRSPIRHAERLACELGRLVRVLQSMISTVQEAPRTQAKTLLETEEVAQAIDGARKVLEMAGCWVGPPADEDLALSEPATDSGGDDAVAA